MKTTSSIVAILLGAMMLSPGHASEPLVLALDEAPQSDAMKKPTVNAYQDLRMAQPDGLGFGPTHGGLIGVMGFYDHTFNASSQLHVQIGYSVGRSETSTTIFGVSGSIDVNRYSALVTYRRFFSPNKGFYYGAGLGYSKNELEYSYENIFTDESASYSASGQGVFALAELGWQGIQGFYINAGIQPGFYISYDDDYDVSRIPDTSNHRRVANDDWDKSKRLTQIAVGFGWFF